MCSLFHVRYEEAESCLLPNGRQALSNPPLLLPEAAFPVAGGGKEDTLEQLSTLDHWIFILHLKAGSAIATFRGI